MSKNDTLEELKHTARRLARARRIAHLAALDLVAQAVGHPHWNALTVALKRGWQPSAAQLDAANGLVAQANPLDSDDKYSMASFFAPPVEGELLGHPYTILTELDDVRIVGRGWSILLREAPKAKPVFEVDRRFEPTPLDKEAFRKAAVEIADDMRKKVHARMASDWPRRSTVPSVDGKAEHPLHNDVSDTWFCLHCGGMFTGRQMAENMWHCPDPDCNGSPIDIFVTAWWLGDRIAG